MSYSRVVHRSALTGGYDDGHTPLHRMIAGDLRRMEADQTDEDHLRWYAECAGVTPDQAAAVLRAFFHGEWPLVPNDTVQRPSVSEVALERLVGRDGG